MKHLPSSSLPCLAAAIVSLALPSLAQSQTVQTGIGAVKLQAGYPSNESVTKIYDALDFQRACQAYIWAIPIVSLNELLIANQIR